MTLPASFAKDGFQGIEALRSGKLRRLMLGTEGWSDTGKTEFAFSAPGPGIVICLDRGLDGILDNPNPPKSRQQDFAVKVIPRLLPTQATQPEYGTNWKLFYAEYMKALNNKDARTIILDTDSDSWELQRLAEFGQLQGVISLRYAGINAARKAMISRAYDSGKIVIGTNRLEEEYETKINNAGKDVQVKTGNTRRQGFKDQSYLWGMQIRHFITEDKQYALEIIKCKADSSLVGMKLIGEECNFMSLVSAVYPQIPLQEWGFK